MLYASDANWWRANKGVPDFKGLKLTQDGDACVRYPDVYKLTVESNIHEMLFDRPGVIGDGRNGGFQALNIVLQFGCKRIILVGYDLRLDRGLHWHGRHGHRLNNPTKSWLKRWAQTLDAQAKRLSEMGIEIVNASPDSVLTEFPKMTLGEALEKWQPTSCRPASA